MITDDEKIIEIVGILAISNINVDDCKKITDFIIELSHKNQELKKQLENYCCNRTDCSARIKDSKQYDSLVQRVENQQEEFMEWLVKMSKNLFKDEEYGTSATYGFILSKYKEIIGGNNE